MNFKDEEIPVQNLKISYLFGKLVQKGINKVFRLSYYARLTLISDSELKEIEKYLKLKNIEQVVNYKPNNVIVYGSGFIAKEMINKSNFFKRLKDYDVVDTDKERIGKTINERIIKPPETIINDNRDIVIASAQAYDEILTKIIQLKGNSKSVLTKLII